MSLATWNNYIIDSFKLLILGQAHYQLLVNQSFSLQLQLLSFLFVPQSLSLEQVLLVLVLVQLELAQHHITRILESSEKRLVMGLHSHIFYPTNDLLCLNIPTLDEQASHQLDKYHVPLFLMLLRRVNLHSLKSAQWVY
jgi:hypothetical protein